MKRTAEEDEDFPVDMRERDDSGKYKGFHGMKDAHGPDIKTREGNPYPSQMTQQNNQETELRDLPKNK